MTRCTFDSHDSHEHLFHQPCMICKRPSHIVHGHDMFSRQEINPHGASSNITDVSTIHLAVNHRRWKCGPLPPPSSLLPSPSRFSHHHCKQYDTEVVVVRRFTDQVVPRHTFFLGVALASLISFISLKNGATRDHTNMFRSCCGCPCTRERGRCSGSCCCCELVNVSLVGDGFFPLPLS